MNEQDMPPWWRQVHTQKFERTDGAIVRRDNQAKREEWIVEILSQEGLLCVNAYQTPLEAIAAADVAAPLPNSISNVIIGAHESTWNTAMDTAVTILENIAVSIEREEMPACCPMCALRFAAGVFAQSKQNKSGMAQLFAEPAGHA